MLATSSTVWWASADIGDLISEQITDQHLHLPELMPENDVPGDPARLVMNEGSKIVLRLDLGGVYVENRRVGRKKCKGSCQFPVASSQ